jgi:organic radical activating enzyme
MKEANLIEVIYTFQGEGPDVGKPMLLLRFKRCNNSCPWCDTQVKMRVFQEAGHSLRSIQEVINDKNCGMLITGGEPTFNLNLNQTISLINEVTAPLYNVESNGHDILSLIKAVRKQKPIKYILSPKIFTEADLNFYKDLSQKIASNQKVFIKLVCEDRTVIHEYLDFLKSINFNNFRVFLMAQGKTRDESLKNSSIIFDLAEQYGYCVSDRMHIIYDFT